MKKLIVAISMLVIGSIVFISYLRAYPVALDNNSLKVNLLKFINRPTKVANDLDMKLCLDIDNVKLVLFLINNKFGDAKLTHGLNNKYKVDNTGYGTSFFRDEVVKTNKGKYIVLKGVNYNNKIAYAKVIIEGREYKVSIPTQEYFIAYTKIPSETEDNHAGIANIRLYDSNDIDITVEMFRTLIN